MSGHGVDPTTLTWRVGRKLRRTLYAQRGAERVMGAGVPADGGNGVVINGIDYEVREVDLAARGIAPYGQDDTAFGTEVYCNQHRRVHSTGWCTVSNIEKFAPEEEWPRTA